MAIAGVGMVRFGEVPDRSTAELARDAGLTALHDAGMTLADVDEAFVGYLQPAALVGVKAMKELGLTGLPVTHVENASATGLVAFREAAWAVESGRAEVAMAIAFDKMSEMGRGRGEPGHGPRPDRHRRSSLPPTSRSGPSVACTTTAPARSTSRPSPPRTGTTAPCARGATAVQITWSPSTRYWHHADREPLTAMMACPADDGAACVIVASYEYVRCRQPDRRLVRPVASALRSETYAPGHTFLGPVVGPATMTRDTANEAYADAGFGPDDVDLALCHDAFANEELEYYELLGFCPDGEGERLLEKGATALGGSIPFNTDGGLIARGHPGGPTGLAMVHEVVQQLRGEAGDRQVDGARTALAHLVGGGSVCTVSLFQAD